MTAGAGFIGSTDNRLAIFELSPLEKEGILGEKPVRGGFVRVVILTSGRGTRLAPLTDSIPKPLLPVANRPLLEYLIYAVAQAGFTEVILTAGYLGSQIEDFVKGISLDLSIQVVPAPQWQKGPLTVFRAVQPFLKDDSAFILLPGDLFVSANVLTFVREREGDDWMLLFDSHQFRAGSILQVNSEGRVTQFDHAVAPVSDWYSVLPILRISPTFFDLLKLPVARKARTVFELLEYGIKHNYPLQGVSSPRIWWSDIDGAHDLIQLNHYLLDQGWPPDPLPPGTYLPPNTEMCGPLQSATLTLDEGSRVLGPVLLGARCHIGKGSVVGEGTSLGAYTTIQANSVVKGCICFSHTQVSANSDLSNAILNPKGQVVR